MRTEGIGRLSANHTPAQPRALRVLVVEDEVLLSMLLEDMLEQLGHEVARVCTDNATALAALEEEAFDLVVLDLNLHGERSEPVAARLREKQVPFIIASGLTDGADGLGAAAVVSKPYLLDDIDRALTTCRELVTS